MTRALKVAALLILAGSVLFCLNGPTPHAGGDEGEVTGRLCKVDGSPAESAKVTFITVDHNPVEGIAKARAVVDSVITDENGVYRIDSLPLGYYNVFGEKDSLKSYLDSAYIPGDDTATLPTDTLKEPGSVVGSVHMARGWGIVDAKIAVMGTRQYAEASGYLGDFVLHRLAEGSYWAKVFSSSNNYISRLEKITIRASERDTLSDPFILVSNTVNTIFVDSRNNIWIGTANGLARYDGVTWKTYSHVDGLSNNTITAITEDTTGMVWVGTVSGLNRFEDTTWTQNGYTHGLSSENIKSLAVDSSGQVWAGTPNGINKFDGEGWSTVFGIDTLVSTSVASIVAADSGVWIGTGSGLTYLSEEKQQSYTRSDGLASNSVTCLAVDPVGRIWIGTEDGLSKFDGSNWETFTSSHGLTSNSITSICMDRQGHVWVGTVKGINEFDGTEWKVYPNATIGNSKINSITVDPNNNIWIGTDNGLVKFDGKNWEPFM